LCDTGRPPYALVVPETPPADQADPMDDSPDTVYPGSPELPIVEDSHESRWPELLRALAEEYGCDLVEASPGRWMIRAGVTSDELERDHPIRP
jgi:hypothetical protein